MSVQEITLKEKLQISEDEYKHTEKKDIDEPSPPPPYVKSDVEKRLVRRMLWILLPFVWAVIFVTFVDKALLSVSAVYGLMEDAHLSDSQFSWVAAVVFLGYLVFQIPNNILIQRLRLSKYLGTLLLIWGVVVIATAFANSFEQLMGLRFLLGAFESGCYPIVYIILNALFRRSEQHFVYAFTIVSAGTGALIGTALGYVVILTLDYKEFGTMGVWRAWRWAYFIFGMVTIGVGVAVFFLLPDTPYAKLFKLNEEEKKVVQDRTLDNMTTRTYTIKRAHIFEALSEFNFYASGLVNLLLSMANAGMIAYAVILVKSFGFSPMIATAMQMPSGAVGAIFALLASLSIRVTGQQFYCCVAFLCITVLGFIILLAAESTAGKMTGFYLTWALSGSIAIQLAVVSSNIIGYTKKVTYYGFYVAAGTVGSFLGPFLMVPSQNFVGGYGGYIGCCTVATILLLSMRWLMNRENQKRRANPVPPPVLDENGVPPDLTDKENLAHIYKL
ncbi:MFS general substrate transporter [Hesseltinella vesiculosa]|uniref:MFS general substrate transporter n=1 Tax=Hesseltinella vesiculosa TaxID=101127 RepID=A0A1X2G890_9FUNG|nr:MFS general substrate transporter [Hesseltinella vesiculosa]